MASIYETKMPAYLAMSRADLIAEVLAHGEIVSAFLDEHQDATEAEGGDAADMVVHIFGGSAPDEPAHVESAREVVRIANDVLKERFNIQINFWYGSN